MRPNINEGPPGGIDFTGFKATEESPPLPTKIMSMLYRWKVRPHSLEVAQLITQHSVTVNDILEAGLRSGYPMPIMEDTQKELQTILPFMEKVVDAIASLLAANPISRVLYLGRDAELLYDAHTAAYPKKLPSLIPGSYTFWGALRKMPIEQQEQFLRSKGITAEAIMSDNTFLLIDSGFVGRSGNSLREAVLRVYGNRPGVTEDSINNLFPIRLIAHVLGEHDPQLPNTQQLMDFPVATRNMAEIFPKSSTAIGLLQHAFAEYFAVALQLMPRFHGQYAGLEVNNGELIGVPTESSKQDVVSQANIDERGLRRNADKVHPPAALALQAEVIRYFLAHNGKS